MVSLTEAWIRVEIRKFDFLDILARFMETYLPDEEAIDAIFGYLSSLSVDALTGLNEFIYRRSFEAPPKIGKLVPDTLSRHASFSESKSCGYFPNSLFLDRLFYSGPDLLCYDDLIQ